MVMPIVSSWLKFLPALALVSVLGGCVTNGPRQEAGTGIGAVAGGVGGALIARNNGMNPVAGAVVGAVAGGIIGNAIGKALDDEERRQLALATQRAANAPASHNQPRILTSAPTAPRAATSRRPWKKAARRRAKTSRCARRKSPRLMVRTG
jgi:phage tail tape-measure protein